MGETRIREQVIGPIEKLLRQLNQEEVRAAVRAELMESERQEKAKSHAGKRGIGDELARLEKRLTTWLEMVGDGEITREEYAKARAEVEPQIKELQSQLAARPHLALPDTEQLFAIADTITVDNLDDQAWRDIIEGMVDRIVIEGAESDGKKAPATIRVVWKPEYTPLLNMVEGE